MYTSHIIKACIRGYHSIYELVALGPTVVSLGCRFFFQSLPKVSEDWTTDVLKTPGEVKFFEFKQILPPGYPGVLGTVDGRNHTLFLGMYLYLLNTNLVRWSFCPSAR